MRMEFKDWIDLLNCGLIGILAVGYLFYVNFWMLGIGVLFIITFHYWRHKVYDTLSKTTPKKKEG